MYQEKIQYVICFILAIFLIYSLISTNKRTINYSIAICLYLLFKWMFNYHKCTISYLECKIRGVKKEQGFLYQTLEKIMDVNKCHNRHNTYVGVFAILLINLIKLIKN